MDIQSPRRWKTLWRQVFEVNADRFASLHQPHCIEAFNDLIQHTPIAK
jgi:hypothetical protein